ncbi:hypothetical protein LCGC14_1116790 [marine sediment metagenome]|uniref:Terminase n=2 Tax=root TaxID=1 RepID=A0A9C9TJ03_9HYPH|nr:hypothetical protein [Aurantimonas coralicida]
MPRAASRDLYVRHLREGGRSSQRLVDLAVEFVDERDLSVLFTCGGRWDRKLKRWAEAPARSVLQVRVHPGQIETVLWFREWLAAYMTGDDLAVAIYSILLLGGTRSGKTWLALRLMVAFAVAVPDARVWAVQEVEVERADELEVELDELLPDAWFTKAGNKYKCANGTTITIRSAKYPQKLKRGRCDFAILNEGQNVSEDAHTRLRERTSDTGGLVVVAANPPNDDPIGEWIGEFAEACKAGRRKHALCFRFVYSDNTHVKQEQIAALEAETDPRTFAIEVKGEVLPPSNAVMHAFSRIENIDEVPEIGDVTAAFLARCALGKGATHFVGLDFQRSPHMAGVVGRAFRNPADVDKPLIYWHDEVIVDLGDEHDLSDGLYELGLDPATTVLICDASGDWQDADRTKGGSSFETLRKNGWRRIFRPDRKAKTNPPLHERFKNDNRLFHAQDGSHIVRIDPRCEKLIECCKKWRRRGGKPDRRSEHAHIGDSMSYANFRLYPRRFSGRGVGYKRLKGRQRADQMRRF